MQAVKDYVFSVAGLAQIISIAGMIISILSFQCKSTKKLCIMQACSGALFALSYVFFGDIAAAVCNGVNIFRGTLFGFAPKKYRTPICIGLICAYAGGTLFSMLYAHQGWFSLVLLLAQCTGTFMVWYNSGKILRILQLAVVSPIWLVNNIMCTSIGGILCECFTIISVIISMIRYRSGKYEE